MGQAVQLASRSEERAAQLDYDPTGRLKPRRDRTARQFECSQHGQPEQQSGQVARFGD